MYAAIQQQNLRTPLVFGVGATAADALDDARRYAETMDDIFAVPCSPELCAAVENGRVECEIVNGVATVTA